MIKRMLFVLFLLFVAFVANAYANPFPTRKDASESKPSYGFSYSFEQAGWYGLDPKKSYIDLLDMGFDWVRLPFFWDQMTGENGELKVEDLEFALAEAEKRGVKAVVVLGAKAPYYPEFHFPGSVSDRVGPGEKIGVDHEIADDIINIDKKVVKKLYNYENISYWQIENEPFLPNSFGISIDKSLLAAEIEAVRSEDPLKRPVIITDDIGFLDNDYKELMALLLPGDVFGVNGYFKTQGTHLFALNFGDKSFVVPWPRGFTWPVQSWPFFSPDYDGIIEYAKQRQVDVWLLEMQAEPYIRNLDDAKAKELSYSAQDLIKADEFLKGFEFGAVGFWGVHFWQFRLSIGDDSWIEAASSVVSQ